MSLVGRRLRALAAIALAGGALAWGVPAARAQGGPPMLTDDPGTPGDGHWEINTAWIAERRPGASADETPLLDLNYGVGERLQLKYEASWLRAKADGATQMGMSNSLVGVKWRFLDDPKTALAISTYPQFEFRNPGSSSARRGLVDDENSLLLPVELTKDLGPVSVNIEVGHLFRAHSPDGWIYGLALGRELNKTIEVAAEVHGEDEDDAGEELAVNVGARVHCTEHGTLLLSVGREVHNAVEARATVLSYVGWQLTLQRRRPPGPRRSVVVPPPAVDLLDLELVLRQHVVGHDHRDGRLGLHPELRLLEILRARALERLADGLDRQHAPALRGVEIVGSLEDPVGGRMRARILRNLHDPADEVLTRQLGLRVGEEHDELLLRRGRLDVVGGVRLHGMIHFLDDLAEQRGLDLVALEDLGDLVDFDFGHGKTRKAHQRARSRPVDNPQTCRTHPMMAARQCWL